MSFVVYDLIFLVLFLIVVSTFLYKRKKNLKREGLLYLYRTKWGINLINKIGRKYQKSLKFLGYVSIVSGYILMISMLYLVYFLIKVYISQPNLVRAIRVPPILPLFPYIPQVLKLEFLPPFYFTYWIIIIAVIAITHEMAHGIFAARDKIKIKTTGFGFFPYFLPIFLAAFVEPDEKVMQKKTRKSQLVILSAGTFANVITAILFFIILTIFFSFAFTPSGVIFDRYVDSRIPVIGISGINGINLSNPSYDELLSHATNQGFNELGYKGRSYLATKEMLEKQKGNSSILVYYSAPAIKNNLSGIITEVNGVKVNSIDSLVFELLRYSPGDLIKIKTITEKGSMENILVLEEHPEREGAAWLGVAFLSQQKSGLLAGIVDSFSFRKPNVYYKPVFGEASIFIYNLIWWIVIISISVALINMLPVGIFDGGRFFYLTILGITKNEKIARGLFIFSTRFFLFLLVALIVLWGFAFLR